MNKTLSFEELLFHFKKNIKYIIVSMMVGLAIASVVSYVLLPSKYEAKTQILVNQDLGNKEQQFQITQSDLQLINTYIGVMKSSLILSEVIDTLDLKIQPSKLSEKIKITSEENSKIMNIIVVDYTANDAVNIANEIVSVFEKEIPKIMEVKNVNILMEATIIESIKPIYPNHLLNMFIGLFLGAAISIVILIIRQLTNNKFNSEEEIIEFLEIPVIGVINKIDDSNRKRKKK